MNIHVTRDGQDFGPYKVEDINGYLKLGSLLPTDMAWHEGLPSWIPLFQIPGVQVPAKTQVRAPQSIRQANPAISNRPRLATAPQSPRPHPAKRSWWIVAIIILTIGLAVVGFFVFRKIQIPLTLSQTPATPATPATPSTPAVDEQDAGVSASEIKNFGKELTGKDVVLVGYFGGIENTMNQFEIRDKMYLGFWVRDTKDEIFSNAYVNKEKHGRTLVNLKIWDKIKLTGRTKPAYSNGEIIYLLVVEDIQQLAGKRPQRPK